MGIEKWLDFILLIILLTTSVSLLPTLFKEISQPIVSTIEDKTAMETEGSLYVGDVIKTGADLFMTLAVTDEYTPFPKSIRINNTPIIDLNKEWVAQRSRNLQRIYSPVGQWKLENMLNWNIVDIEYVPNNGDPYLQYTLEEEGR